MTSKHPITALSIWAFEQGFTIIAIKHILRIEFDIRGRRVTDAISKSLGPRQIKKNARDFNYIQAAIAMHHISDLEDLITFFDERNIDYWSTKQLLKQSSIWDDYESNIVWRRFQRLQRKEQRQSLANWSGRSLTEYVRVNNIYTP